MLQVVQYQKTGEMQVLDLPAPQCPENGILVRNVFSLISAGTEKTSVSNSSGSLISRAKKQPDAVKLVLDFVKKQGIKAALDKVRSKLDTYKNPGYSSAGVVLESRCPEFSPGDRVACAGANIAVHAEVVAIPKNLAVKIPQNVNFQQAAFTTVCSIAMQGVRRAAPNLGENVAVIGLGLIGQITVRLLKAAGCRVAGLDLNSDTFETAGDGGCDICIPSSGEYYKSLIAFSGGNGFDSVIITASTGSSIPVNYAMKLVRKRGRVVVVGAVGMDVQRGDFYKKEADLLISCSYGPGRYDSDYEELGRDYPAGFVRWTENRNMQAILDLMSCGKLDVRPLITQMFDISKAPGAYKIITGEIPAKHIGILLHYPERQEKEILRRDNMTYSGKPLGKVNVGFVGAGIFAQNHLIPALLKTSAVPVAITAATPSNAVNAAKKFGFGYGSTDSEAMINDEKVNAVFCATRHNLHAHFVLEAVRAGKPVYVEKPLCVSREQLAEIDNAVAQNSGRVMVGYNRRFSKPFAEIKKFFADRTDPMNILYRVNAGSLPPGNWLYQPDEGMGRIIGEGCHFIDCMAFLTGALPVSVYAASLGSSDAADYNFDNSSLVIKFSDGSVGTLAYYANGDTAYAKEYCEAFSQGATAVMNNFTEVRLFRAGKETVKKFDGTKGHSEEVAATVKSIAEGTPMPIDYASIRSITLCTIAAIESAKSGKCINIE